MTATFNPALRTEIDRIRFQVGDTNTAKALIQDETIVALLAEAGATPASVAASVAEHILTIYQQRVTYDVDGQGEHYSDLAKNYPATVARLVGLANAEKAAAVSADKSAALGALGGGIMPMGVSKDANVDRSEDPDRAANYSPRYIW